MKLRINELELILGEFRLNCDLDLPSGKLITLLGPSGCGKTSLLKSVAGLHPLDRGRIILGERDISSLDPRQRKIGMVFQDYALFPHMTVSKNICYGMKQRGEAALSRCRELLALVELEGFEQRMPEELSGGEKQRVALARALASEPDLLLLDEPLSALDARLRRILRRQIREIQNKTGITTLYVTHDQEEAMAISDWIVLMERGRVCQEGSPEELYTRPANAFAGRFIGSANMIPVRFCEQEQDGQLRLHCKTGEYTLHAVTDVMEKKEGGYLYFRPEDCRLERSADPAEEEGRDGTEPDREDLIRTEGDVVYREFGGDFILLEVRWEEFLVRIKAPASHSAAPGERLGWSVRKKDCAYLN